MSIQKSNAFYFNGECCYENNLDENIILVIERLNHSVAHVYFTDNQKQMINIPSGFSLFDKTNNVDGTKFQNGYYLCWTDSYCMKYNDLDISLITERRWEIQTTKTTIIVKKPKTKQIKTTPVV